MSNSQQIIDQLNQLKTEAGQTNTTISALQQSIQNRVNFIEEKQQEIKKKTGILMTRQQMLDSLISLNNYKQKIIYMLICSIVIIFIIFALLVYLKNGSKVANKINKAINNRRN
jgi:predicted PurR-regulated permease PerM